MNTWLIKSEPATWSWQDQVRDGKTSWDGVRNYQACNNLKAMNLGDLAFFYHSGDEKKIVGIVEVAKTSYPDPADETGRFSMVDIKTVKELPNPVSLKEIKSHPELQDLALVKQSRLSVMPVDKKYWDIICKLGGIIS